MNFEVLVTATNVLFYAALFLLIIMYLSIHVLRFFEKIKICTKWIPINPDEVLRKYPERQSSIKGSFHRSDLFCERTTINIINYDVLPYGMHGSGCLCGKTGLLPWLRKVVFWKKIIIKPVPGPNRKKRNAGMIEYYLGFIEYQQNGPIAMYFPRPRILLDGPFKMRVNNCPITFFTISDDDLILEFAENHDSRDTY